MDHSNYITLLVLGAIFLVLGVISNKNQDGESEGDDS